MRIFSKHSLISILHLGILLTLFQPSLAGADVITPGMIRVSYCFKITNIDKYPDYLFMVVQKSDGPEIPPWNRLLKSDKCYNLDGYRAYGEVYALKKSDVDLKEDIIGEFEHLKDFENKKAKLIPATRKINPIRRMKDIYQIDKVVRGYEIDDINNRYLSLRTSSITYIYKNNKWEKKAVLDEENLPLPSSYNTAFLWYVPIFGISLIGGAAYWKKSNKSKKAE